MILEDSVPR